MPTFEQLILSASTLAQGATLEQHLNNLNAAGGGITLLNVGGIDVGLEDDIVVALADDPIYVVIGEVDDVMIDRDIEVSINDSGHKVKT